MNEKLEKIISKVAKPVAKVMLPLALTFGAYQGANAQTYGPPKNKGTTEFIILSENERTISVDQDVSPFNSTVTQNTKYTLDVLTVKGVNTGETYILLYPGDLTWNKGDVITASYVNHKDRSRKWTNYELIRNRYLHIPSATASNENGVGFYDAVITDLRDVKPGNGN